MVNKNLLHSKLVISGDNWLILARKLNMYTSTLHSKLRGATEFKASEIAQIIRLYNLTPEDVIAIFFSEAVA